MFYIGFRQSIVATVHIASQDSMTFIFHKMNKINEYKFAKENGLRVKVCHVYLVLGKPCAAENEHR